MTDRARNVIIVGASSNRERFGNKAVRAYRDEGFSVYPVHPAETEVEGLPVSKSVAEVPAEADLLLLYVRPDVGLGVVEEAAAKGIRRVFINPGTGSPELVARIRALGMQPVDGCAILALGRRPAEYPA